MNPTVGETKKNNAWYDFSILVGWLIVCHDDSQKNCIQIKPVGLQSSFSALLQMSRILRGVSRDIPQERLQRRLSRLHWSYYSCVTSFAFLAWSCPSCTGLGFHFFCLFLFLYVLPWLALFIFLLPLFALLQLVRTCVKSYRILSSLPPSATNLNQRRETEQHEKIRGVMFF